MQRSVKSQALTLHRGPIVLHSQSVRKTPTKQGHSVVCASFMWLRFYFCAFIRFMSAGDFRRMIRLWKAFFYFFPISAQPPSAEAVFSLSARPTLSSNPGWSRSRHIRPCLSAPKQEAATLDSLSYYLGRRPAMPLTLCHIAWSHYKPFGSRGPPACILSAHMSTCVSACGFVPTGSWKTLCPSLDAPCLGPRRSHFYLLSGLTAGGMTGESVLSVRKCLTIQTKFSMRGTRRAPLTERSGRAAETEVTEGPTSVSKQSLPCHRWGR